VSCHPQRAVGCAADQTRSRRRMGVAHLWYRQSHCSESARGWLAETHM